MGPGSNVTWIQWNQDLVFSPGRNCGILSLMGNKDRGKKEVKKAPKPKAKPEPGRKREIFSAPPPPK
jgi:hypothetical protein